MSVKIGRNDPCWCKSGRKYKACHQAFDEKIAAIAAQGHIVPTHDIIKNADQMQGLRRAARSISRCSIIFRSTFMRA